MISSSFGRPTMLVFRIQMPNFIPKFWGVPPERGLEVGGVGKFSDFLALSDNISKTVADTAKVTIND